MKFGIIKEGKVPQDNRVAFTPKQCKWLQQNKGITVLVESSAHRCFTDEEYRQEGIQVVADVSSCDVLFGIKEIPVDMLIPEKTYFFFSHTRKMQPYNQKMMRDIVSKKITLVDYECLEHADGARVLGFGFFAGV
ncbi:MAG TPA: alanine dehydrogenase, partial [Ginsengibacter sp.]|nr:alanine dehydrogenase [Ginsengibacter sp.]